VQKSAKIVLITFKVRGLQKVIFSKISLPFCLGSETTVSIILSSIVFDQEILTVWSGVLIVACENTNSNSSLEGNCPNSPSHLTEYSSNNSSTITVSSLTDTKEVSLEDSSAVGRDSTVYPFLLNPWAVSKWTCIGITL
jgi:hypothetical protein